MSATLGGVAVFVVLVLSTWTGVIYDVVTSPGQLVVIALIYLVILWTLSNLVGRGAYRSGVGLTLGGFVAAVLSGTGGRMGYAVAFLVVSAVGLVLMQVEQRERGLS